MAEPPASQYTGTFLNLLEKSGRSLVLSTYQARKLVLLRVQGTDLNTHFVNVKKPMGMAYQNGRLSVGSGNSVIDYFNSENAAAKVPPANSHDAAFLPRRAHISGDIDIHEMAFDDSGELWIVNTRMSCLCTLDVKHSFVPRWRPPFVSAYDGTDRCHLNGLAMRDGQPRYVTALGATDTPGGWRDHKATGGVLLDVTSNRVIADKLSMPHSPRWYRDRLWVLESGTGQLLTIDETTGEIKVIAEVPGFCRGLDFIDRYALIGLSEVREAAVFAGLPLTAREQDRKCGIWIVDTETGMTTGYLAFTTGVQEIFAVLALPMRYPALLDFDDRLLDTTYSVPSSVIDEFAPPDPRQLRIDTATEHHRRKEFSAAIDLYRQLLADTPGDSNILYRLADALSQSGRWDDAIVCLDRVIALQTEHAPAHLLCGRYFQHRNEPGRAIECYDRAIAIDRQFAAAWFHRGCARLAQGDFRRGFEDYEWRMKIPGAKTFSLPRPQWRGEDIRDKTLLVLTEAGVADAILFARFLPLAKERCKQLILVCDASLRSLLRDIEAVDEVREHGRLQSDRFDVYASIASLGALLQIGADQLQPQYPYLTVNTGSAVTLRGTKPKVGLLWSDNAASGQGANLACQLDDIIGLAADESIDCYSFQTPVFAADRDKLHEHKVTDLEPELGDYARTAALLLKMDMFVSVPSAIAHLAGALGVPTKLLLSDHDDWRWASDGKNSTWYPSVEILRRSSTASWRAAAESCAQLVKKMVSY